MRTRQRVRVIESFFVVSLIAIAAACEGFFVDPTLVGMTLSTLQSTNLPNAGSTTQLAASGSYDDGSHKNLTGHATWSATPSNFVTLSTTTPGLVTAQVVTNPATSVTVQAAEMSSNGLVVAGTITLTVGTSSTLTITSTPSSPISISGSGGSGGTVQFAATLNGSSVTGSTTFTSSNSSIISIPSGSSSGTLGGTTGTVTITGTNSSMGASGTLLIVVTS